MKTNEFVTYCRERIEDCESIGPGSVEILLDMLENMRNCAIDAMNSGNTNEWQRAIKHIINYGDESDGS